MLIHPLPDPVAIQLGPLAIHWYGLMYVAAFVQFILLGNLRLRQPHIEQAGWNRKDLDNLLFYGAFGVIIGGRLGEVFFYNPSYFLSHPLEILAVWQGGMSYHGGFIGVFIAMWFYGKKYHKGFIPVLDFIAPLVPLGYAAGRIGNFINAELPGRVADASLPWAMIWPNVDMLPRHPSPLYQALFDGVIMFFLLWGFARKPHPDGAVSAFYLFLYGITRFFTEYFRIPDYTVSFLGVTISAGQMLSLPMILAAIIWFSHLYARKSHDMLNKTWHRIDK
ncbi:prolipoprotein diacylglyceryl transferase [Oxalobacter vibrioformis]|uniref:Phosphatidylglycerol--prolipoprotein diacylglyceryl transferase n=1 Tax=Oxalobacter vibrioformis TaxID=933080 RepID=A0A9E9P2H4_9BURK|nr:prolipoprotein diacylglyceryl transferase [Oxalobacter vibrioformis]NLC23803.1 prolipoprotein diacylglyceryl transferase [Oxalobacter sp.]WAW09225.1 prolipoprotein diacylglyceryl transferase [Oxalobacter vibrioformis]